MYLSSFSLGLAKKIERVQLYTLLYSSKKLIKKTRNYLLLNYLSKKLKNVKDLTYALINLKGMCIVYT
jgi:hypothetical protein